MTDRVHPRDHSSPDQTNPSQNNMSIQEKPASPPVGTYVVQIPKDQIYRVPPPENAQRYQKYARRKQRRNPCCCCLCWILGIIVLLILLTAVAAGVFYLVFRPKEPNYSVENVSIKGINLSSSDLTFSPEFDVTVRAENPNNKIGIYYEKESSVLVFYSSTNLVSGRLPPFYQPANNVTIFGVALKGPGLKLRSKIRDELQEQQKKGKIPLGLDLKVPVKIKVGSVKTWTITVKVHCDITVNKLAMDSKIVSKDCGVGLKLWKD